MCHLLLASQTYIDTLFVVPCKYLACQICLHGAFTRGRRMFGRSKFGYLGVAFTWGRLTDLKLGHLRVHVFSRLGKSTFFGTCPVKFANGQVWTALAGQIFATLLQRGCQYAIKKPWVNDKFFLNELLLQESY